jgi:hypothetical protein
MIERCLALSLEAALSCIEHHRVLKVLVPGLVKGLWSLAFLFAVLILPRSGNIEFQTLTVVSLIEMESGRSTIETNFLAYLCLEVRRTSLLQPLRFAVGRVAETCDLVFDSNLSLIVHHNFSVHSLSHELFPRNTFACEEAHVRILS